MVAQRRVVPPDPGESLSHRARNGASRALRCVTGAPITASHPDSTRQFPYQEVAFGIRLRRARRVAEHLRLRDVLVDLGETTAIRGLGARVEQFAGITCCGEGERTIAHLRSTSLESDKVQHMELSSGISKEPCQVPHAFRIPNACGVPLEDH